MAILKAREGSSDTFKPVATMGVGNASQSQRGLMTAQDKVKLDNVADYIIERGTTTTTKSQGGTQTWYYEKWNSGFLKAYTEFKYTGLNCSTQDSGASVYHTPSFQENFPAMFTDVYTINSAKSGGTAGWLQVGTGFSLENHLLPQCYIVRGNSNANMSSTISVIVRGTWK